ncbi:MAG: YCF48-related protein [Acidobacteriota bacterium]
MFEHVELLDRSHWLLADFECLWKSDDGGLTWRQSFRVNADSVGARYVQGLSFLDGRVGFLSLGQHVLRTADGGASWTETALPEIWANDCYFVDELRGWVVGHVSTEGWLSNPRIPQYVGAVFATQDGGKTWQRQRLPPRGVYSDKNEGIKWTLADVLFRDARVGWALGDEIAFWTTDGGETWRQAEAPRMRYKSIEFLDDQFGWATERDGTRVAVTTDGGQRWRLVKALPAFGTWKAQVVFVTPSHGFATVLALYETTDGGRSWTLRLGSNRIGEASYYYVGRPRDGTLVALGSISGSVTSLISTDVGETWHSGDH